MKSLSNYYLLAVLFLASAVSTLAQTVPAADNLAPESDGSIPLFYDLTKPFVLNCTLNDTGNNPIEWRKNNTLIEDLKTETKFYKLLEGGRVLNVTRAGEEDYGPFSCAVKGAAAPAISWTLYARVYAKLNPDTSSVEGQATKFSCKLIGRPFPAVTWSYNNTLNNVTRITGQEDGFELEANDQGAADTVLVIKSVTHEHAGSYACEPANGTPDYTLLRVKGVNAALWPFLGICAEVLVLCAIILFYEKRRTKLEPDDSDTDNNDQKKS